MKIVVKLGGHLFPAVPSPKEVSTYVEVLNSIVELGHQLIVVTGGGKVAREYIDAARSLGASEYMCDVIGIEVSRLNARLFICRLGEAAYTEPVTTLQELRRVAGQKQIIVLGGLHPGQSTNAVGIQVAEAINADLFINATNVDGVYTADPDVDVNAEKMDVITTGELLKMLLSQDLEAGGYVLFDPVAIKIVERSGIPTRIIDGRTPANILETVKGRPIGTLIKPGRDS